MMISSLKYSQLRTNKKNSLLIKLMNIYVTFPFLHIKMLNNGDKLKIIFILFSYFYKNLHIKLLPCKYIVLPYVRKKSYSIFCIMKKNI